jgi:hypothetical protein
VLLVPASAAHALDTTVPVSARANIFGAGHATSDGVLPPVVAFQAGGGKVLTVARATGTAQGNCPNEPFAGPDGQSTPGGCTRTDISSSRGIAGIVNSQGHMFMVGVFLDDSEPQDPAPAARLDFSPPPVGRGESFTSLAPGLRRPFFIGDGLTRTGSGAVQQFTVPPTATRLFLGIAEAFGFVGPPGAAGDNSGEFTAPVRISGAAPVLGKSVAVEVVSGVVLVDLPGRAARSAATVPGLKGRDFVPITTGRSIPTGSIVDARKGTIRLTSARNTRGATQSGDFGAGVFQVLQSRGRKAKGLTNLRMKGGSFGTCRSTKASAARTSRRRVRRLRGNAKGRFRTTGRYSSATVRGTAWDVADRCDGTLTKVSRGKVAVRDFRRRRTVTVRAGRSYFAPGRR